MTPILERRGARDYLLSRMIGAKPNSTPSRAKIQIRM